MHLFIEGSIFYAELVGILSLPWVNHIHFSNLHMEILIFPLAQGYVKTPLEKNLISTAHFFKVLHLLSSDDTILANQVKNLRFCMLDLAEYKIQVLIYNFNHKSKHITLMIQRTLEVETYTEIEFLLFHFTR